MRQAKDIPTIDCAAGDKPHKGPQDKQWPQLCQRCGNRLRQIDADAASPFRIRGDMIRSGIPVGRTK